jgi:hypothetical protein
MGLHGLVFVRFDNNKICRQLRTAIVYTASKIYHQVFADGPRNTRGRRPNREEEKKGLAFLACLHFRPHGTEGT